jgi:hypothetical protein
MIRYELKKIFGSVGGKIALGLYIATVISPASLQQTDL